MKRNKLTDMMIRTAVSKVVRDIQDDSDRGYKSLIELGYKFAANKAQKDLLDIAARELNNKNSAYYNLAERLFKGTDQKVLTEFGINLGYNALTDGAGILRELEKGGYNIPWTIFFDMSWGSYPPQVIIDNMIKEGIEIGIYSYMFHIDRKYPDIYKLLDIFSKYSDCAFVLFLYTPTITKELINKVLSLKNVMIFLKIDSDQTDEFKNAAGLLVRNKCLCGGFTRYSSQVRPPQDMSFLKAVEMLGFPIMCMMSNERLRPVGGDGMKRFINKCRSDLLIPVFPIDLWEDIAELGRRNSTGALLMTVSGGDQIIVTDMDKRRNMGGININKPLVSIFNENLMKL